MVLAALGTLATVAVPAAHALQPPQVYWGNISGTIGAANIDGTAVNQSFITGASDPFAVAVDGQHIYWANAGGTTIGRANLDGSGVNQNFITGLDSPYGVAVSAGHIYWAAAGDNAIGEANLDGSAANRSFISTNGPIAVAVDGRHIYWATGGTTIGEANLDGSGVNQNFVTGIAGPSGVAVDGQHIYWTDFNSNVIGEANLDGSAVNRSFITGASLPWGVAVDGEHLYWANSGGGYGTTVGSANVDGTAVNQSFIGGTSGPYGVAVSVPVAQVAPAAPPAFATTPRGTLGLSQSLTISNGGQRNLSLSGLSFTGADPGDFIVSANSCLSGVAPGESCQITVSFAPQAAGGRSAVLQIASNDYADSPLQVPLSGTGGSLPQGPAGVQGPAGPQGPSGRQGPAGAAGKIEVITCKTVSEKVKRHGHEVHVKRQKCTGRLVNGTVRFTTAAGTRATLSRGRLVYASGVSVLLGGGRMQLQLSDRRLLKRGRYTLTQRTRRGRRWLTRRAVIQLS